MVQSSGGDGGDGDDDNDDDDDGDDDPGCFSKLYIISICPV